MPNVVALTSEYSPKRLQTVFVAMLFCGMPLGALVGGLASSVMIPLWGWRSVFFYLGGILPLLIALILIKALPESVRFLTERGKHPREILRIMQQISPGIGAAELDLSPRGAPGGAEANEGLPVRRLFTEDRAAGTILLWIPFFMNLLILYFIVNWLPGTLAAIGPARDRGSHCRLAFQPGRHRRGAQRRARDEFLRPVCHAAGAIRNLGSAHRLAGVSDAIVRDHDAGHISAGPGRAGRAGRPERAGREFLSHDGAVHRVGWALGIGRIGSIVGPAIGGLLLSMGWGPQRIFLAGMAPALCAAIAIWGTSRLRGQANVFAAELDPGRA